MQYEIYNRVVRSHLIYFSVKVNSTLNTSDVHDISVDGIDEVETCAISCKAPGHRGASVH